MSSSELTCEYAAYGDPRCVLADALEAAQARIAELEDAIANPHMTGINLGAEGLDLGMKGPGPKLIAGMFVGLLEANPEATNYLELTFDSPQGRIVVNVQRPSGKTPHQLRKEAEAELAAARADAERYRWLPGSVSQGNGMGPLRGRALVGRFLREGGNGKND